MKPRGKRPTSYTRKPIALTRHNTHTNADTHTCSLRLEARCRNRRRLRVSGWGQRPGQLNAFEFRTEDRLAAFGCSRRGLCVVKTKLLGFTGLITPAATKPRRPSGDCLRMFSGLWHREAQCPLRVPETSQQTQMRLC